MWNDLLVALALMLVVEGMLPFLTPTLFKRTLVTMLQMDERALRLVGLASMIIGLGLLY